ncbi:MAG: polyprenyl synthetase family protein [Lachnospiraceae bacterium]|nr:polyprenyl synthetase family protein [Lachnospiraceae bacterium]
MDEALFEVALKQKTGEVQTIISDILSGYLKEKEEPYVQTILDAMEYSFLAGGKRLRPLLMRETYRLFDQNLEGKETLGTFMTALEMIHTYSLVHDDLPAMDNDEYRRGKETTWKVYGDGMAVLAGDALMNSAFEIAFREIDDLMEEGRTQAEIGRAAKCGVILSRKAGIDGMLGGQVADVEAEKKHLPMDLQKILFIHEKKTAALIETAMGIGAELAGASKEEYEKVVEIARKVGIAFQIQDDVLDVIGDSAELGKHVGSDAESGKETFVTLRGLEISQREVKRLSDEAIELLGDLPGDHAFLEELIRHLIYRRK